MIDANWLANAYTTATQCTCGKCGKTGVSKVKTAAWVKNSGATHPSIGFYATVGNRAVLCEQCWNERYVVCAHSGRIIKRVSSVDIPRVGRVSRLCVAHYVCPVSGVAYTHLKSLADPHYSNSRKVFVVTVDDDLVSGIARLGSEYLYSRTGRFTLARVSGLHVKLSDGVSTLSLDEAMGSSYKSQIWTAPDGRRWCFFGSGNYICPAEDTIKLEDTGRRVHRLEAHVFRCVCSVTGKDFYADGGATISLEGREIARERGMILCSESMRVIESLDNAMIDGDDRIIDPHHVGIGAIYYGGSDYLTETGQHGRTLGVELELEVPVEQQARVWRTKTLKPIRRAGVDGLQNTYRINMPPVSAHSDGSLRGSHPVEYVSPILYESNYESWVDNMCNALRGSVVYSRAGFHLHIGTKDMCFLDLMRLGAWAQKHQQWFYRIVSPSRSSNVFVAQLPDFIGALPLITTKSRYMGWMYGRRELGQKNARNKRANDMGNHAFANGVVHRYQWLNFHSHVYRRTVEIRLHHATANATKIKNWCRLWLSIFNHFASGGSHTVQIDRIISPDLMAYYEERRKQFDARRSSPVQLAPANRGLAVDPSLLSVAAGEVQSA